MVRTQAQNLDAPQIRCITVLANGNVQITWDQIADPNGIFQSYNLINGSGILTTINNITTTSHIHAGAGANASSQQFWMQSIATNSAQNSSISTVVNSIFLQVNNPGNGTAWLTWNPISVPKLAGASDYYHIWKEYPMGTWTLIDSVLYGNESYIDTITVCGDLINYKVSMTNGNCASESNIDGGFFQDVIAPEIPSIEFVEVDTSNGNALVNWFQSGSGDTEAYIVFYFDGSGWVILDTVWGINNTNYTHVGAGADSQFMNYGIAAFDSCWTNGSPNTSALGIDQRTIFLETTPIICDNGLKLDWNTYLNWNAGVANYEVFGSENNGPFVSYGTTAGTSLSFVGLNSLSNYCFVVKATSGDGVTSLSNRTCSIIYEPVQPSLGYLTTATVQGGDVLIKYMGDPSASLQSIRIERSNSLGGTYSVIGSTSIAGPITSFIDQTANPDERSYYYRIVAIDTCGNESIISNAGKNIHAQINVDDNYHKNTVTWNYYEDWDGGIMEYEIYRSINGVYNSTPIATVNPSADIIEDEVSHLLDTEGEFCYYIKAKENLNSYGIQEVSISNVVCAYMSSLVWVPNAIVVNGVNQEFKPVMGFIDFSEYNMRIFDRWGQVIFETDDINTGWDGSTPNGDKILSTYVYQITYRNSIGEFRDKKGTVTVVQ